MNNKLFLLHLAPFLAAFLVPDAHAQILWSALPATDLWNDPANWIGDNVPDTNSEQAVFDVSNVNSVSLNTVTTIQKLTFSAAAPAYTLSGSALTIDVNTASTAVPDALFVAAGAGAVVIGNALTLTDSNATGGNVAPTMTVGAGSTLTLNGALSTVGSTVGSRNLSFTGDGAININGAIAIGVGQIQHNGNATVNIFTNPTSTGQIRSLSNGGGGIRIGSNVTRALGLGLTAGNTHVGRIFLTGNGVVTSGALSTGGGSGTGTNTMDVTFGTDIPGAGSATHSAGFTFTSLNAGFTGTTALIRLDVGTDDTLNMTGAIAGTAGGFSAPLFRKQGLGTAVLSGANTYTIPTEVAAGTLLVTPAQTGGSAITVNDGATFGVNLTGAGTSFNTSVLTVGTATGATLLLNTGALGNPTAPVINVGTLSLNAPVTVNLLGSNLTAGSFALINYTGAIGGSGFGALTTLSLPFRVSGALVDNSANSSVDVNIAGIDTPKWRGNLSADWDIDPLNNGAVGTANWRTLTTNVPTRYVQGSVGVDSVIFDDTATGTTDVNLTASLSPRGITVNNSALTYTFSGTGRFTGDTILTKDGIGTLIIRNTTQNDSTGVTTVNNGILQVGDGATIGTGSFGNGPVVNHAVVVIARPDDATIGNAMSGTGMLVKLGANNLTLTGAVIHTGVTSIAHGTLTLNPTASFTFASPLSGGGTLLKAGAATVALTGDNAAAFTGLTNITEGTLQVGNGAVGNPVPENGLSGTLGTGLVNLAGGVLAFNRNDTSLIVPNAIAGGSADSTALTINGAYGSIVTLTGDNTFLGNVTATGGALRITKLAALGSGNKTINLSKGTNGRAGLYLDGSGHNIALPSGISFVTSNADLANPAILNEAGDNSIAGNFTLTSGGDATRIRVNAGSLMLTGDFVPNTTDRFLILDGAANGTITGNINDQNSTNVLGLIKEGAGTWFLAGTNNYSVSTTVNAGTLLTTTFQTGNAPVTIADGATFGISARAAGGLFNASSLTLGSVTGATLRLDVGLFGNPSFPLLYAPTLSVSNGSIIDLRGSGFSVGGFPAIRYVDTIGNAGFLGLSLVTSPRIVASLVDNSANSSVDIDITDVNFPRWNGDVSGDWNIDNGTGTGTQNWREQTSGNPTRYRQDAPDTDNVIFDDNATGTTTVELTTSVKPGGIHVNNTAKNYVFTGIGKVSGMNGLLKSGDGVLSIVNTTTNDYLGVTIIDGGTIIVGDGSPGVGSLGTGGVTNNATLILNRPDDFTIAGPVGGSGTMLKRHTGTVTFSGANTLAGDIDIEGTLRFTAGGSLGGAISGAGALTIDGGTLDLNGAIENSYTGVTTVNAGGLRLAKVGGHAIGGDLIINGAATVTTLLDDQIPDTATITHNGSMTFDPVGAISDTVANVIINATGTGQFVVRGTWNITGTTIVNSGRFAVGSGATANLGAVVLNAGIFLLAANFSSTTVNIGDGGLTVMGGVIEIGEGTGPVDAVLNLGGDFTALASVNINRGGFTGAQLREINLGSASRTFNIAAGTTTVLPDIRNGELVKDGAGTLTLNGAQEYAALTTNDGVTNLNSVLANAIITDNGGILNINVNADYSTINANGGTVNLTVSQTLAALNIGPDGLVVLDAPAPAAEAQAFDALPQEAAVAQAVPEPGITYLLFLGILGLLRRPYPGARSSPKTAR